MKFDELSSGMILVGNNGTPTICYLFFIKEIRRGSIILDNLLMSANSKTSYFTRQVVPATEWNDDMMIYYDSVVADENWKRRFMKGVFGVPLMEKK